MNLKYVFGPVASRRLSMSLGIDLVPRKVCSMDCLYCEVGKTTKKTTERRKYVPFDAVKLELEKALSGEDLIIDFITFSGYGEPTLFSHLGKLVKFIKNTYQYPIALLTNSTLLIHDDVLKSIADIDVILPSLDTTFQSTFLKLNRPVKNINIDDIIEGIRKLIKTTDSEVWIETLFVKGFNDSKEEINGLKKVINELSPDKWHINTVARPSAYNVYGLSYDELEDIADTVGFGRTEIITDKTYPNNILHEKDISVLKDSVYKLVLRRPCFVEEIKTGFGISDKQLKNAIRMLEKEGKVETIVHSGRKFLKGLK